MFLVRLPVGEAYLKYEDKLFPDFDSVIKDLTGDYNITYLNYSDYNSELSMHDGHHLFSNEAKLISERLAEDIKSKIVY